MKVIWLFSILCHFSCHSVSSQNCSWASELTFQDAKNAIDKMNGIDDLTNRIANLEEHVTTLQKYVPRIIFHAKVSDGVNPSGERRLVYDAVIVNKGSAYNSATGVFTAPLAGTYLFTYSLLGGPTSEVRLVKNEEDLSYIHTILSTGEAQTGSMPVILTLESGDQIWVKLIEGNTWSGRGALNFQGILLEASLE
ncbi:complement C1q-like protein 4 [Chiloscyllium punctatum]|uniref:complement C1q-like protein 4 n=1 Tax=Chiloscyllium punctatum TaxID=137246 RepID=UPI003B63C32D